MTHTSRPFRDAADREALAGLLARARPPEHAGEFPTLTDLDEAAQIQDGGARQVQLWHAASGALIAFGLLYLDYGNLYWEVDPSAPGRAALEDEIIAWGANSLRRACLSQPGLALDTTCRADDAARLDALARNGFIPQPEETLALQRDLRAEIAPPCLPSGYQIRPARGEEEVDELVALHRAAFGTDNMTVEERLAMMRVPVYDPTLDLLAVAPDGVLAAFVVASIDPAGEAGRTGWTDPLGTHPAHRRRGLMRALLLTAFQALRRRGCDIARLGTGSHNADGLATFLALGFTITARRRWYSKPLATH